MSADEDEGDAEPKVRGDASAGVISDDEDEVTAPASRRYALDPALALGPRLLAPRMDGVLRFRETLDPTALDDVDAGEGADAGAWYAFENGVAFVSASAPPLALVVGVNVVAVDVHEGIRDPDDEPAARGAADAADALVVFRMAKNAPGTKMDASVDAPTSTAWCFSLSAVPVAARRRFLREIVPRWRAAAANANEETVAESESSAATFRVAAALPAYARATEAQRWAVGLALARQRHAGNIAAAVAGETPHKTFPTHAPDARVADAANAASGFDTTRRYSKGNDAPTTEPETRPEGRNSRPETRLETRLVPVTLLTGPPGGCQASTASALTEGASASAAWIVAHAASLRAFAAPTASCFASALEDAARRAAETAGSSNANAIPPPPRVLVTVETYAPPAVTVAALRRAIERVNAETEANEATNAGATALAYSSVSAPPLRLLHAGTTACLTSEAFFADGERHPSLGSLAHAASSDVDAIVLLQSWRSGTASRDAVGVDGDVHRDRHVSAVDTSSVDSSSVADRERFADASAWIRAAARGDVEHIFGAARLGRDPLAAATRRSRWPSPSLSPSSARHRTQSWESTLVASHADAPIRARVSARRVVAVGRFDVGALVASVRRAFGAGRVAPPLGPDANPSERADLESARFLERDPNDETRAATLTWARVRAWVDVGAEEARDATRDANREGTDGMDARGKTAPNVVVLDASFDFASAAPFSLGSVFPPTPSDFPRAIATATRVEVLAAGSDVATRLDLGGMCRAAVVAAPAPAPRKTEASMSAKERAALAETCASSPTPEGWYHDGARYVRHDGLVSGEHPSLREAIEAYLRDANAEAEERDAARTAANARDAATTRVVTEETSDAREFRSDTRRDVSPSSARGVALDVSSPCEASERVR